MYSRLWLAYLSQDQTIEYAGELDYTNLFEV